MLLPLSWLKEYVDIKMPFPKFAARMSEVGLTIEVWHEENGDIVFDPEITPNRSDWMSVTGIARETAAATGAKFTPPKLMTLPAKIKNPLPLEYKDDPKLCPRTSRVLIRGVKVKSSPEWLQKRIKQIGLRPINNLVDITNYVLWMYGVPLHVFDYDKIRGHTMTTTLSKGGEEFRSLDGIDYKLPKDAIIIKDVGRIVDLLPLKGGENTAVSNTTTNILLHSIVCDPVITRRTSQTLNLRSDSSAVSERGIDPNGTTKAALKALELILELAGGEMASPLIDVPEKPASSWTVEMSQENLEKVLGIPVTPKQVADILESLEFKVENKYKVTVPTFRNDVHLEEDVIEEIGRIIGYNSFPKTLPQGQTPTAKVAYTHDYSFDYQIKQILKGAGYNEIYTYSLVSEGQLAKLSIDPAKALRLDNPISREYEYMRPHLMGNLLDALKLNSANFEQTKLFEFGKIFQGENCDKITERYQIAAIIFGENFYQAKGDIQLVLGNLGITADFFPAEKELNPNLWLHTGRVASIMVGDTRIGMLAEVHPQLLNKFGIKGHATEWTLNRDLLEKFSDFSRKYQAVPKYPPLIEDISLVTPDKVLVGEIIDTIMSSSKLVKSVDLLDTHEDTKTFRLTYLDVNKNLTDREVAEVRAKILHNLKEKLKVTPKS